MEREKDLVGGMIEGSRPQGLREGHEEEQQAPDRESWGKARELSQLFLPWQTSGVFVCPLAKTAAQAGRQPYA